MATFEVDVCAADYADGRSVRYDTPETFPVESEQIGHVGTCLKADTVALTTIHLRKIDNSLYDIMALHVVQSPMAVRQRAMAAGTKTANDPVFTLPVTQPASSEPTYTSAAKPAAAPGPAKVRMPATASGGF